ncbi:transaldolase [Flavobacteriaceae bacterium F89]|uniref:Transaldolase n=1 Tax=Cerina litoralis TaxID=2874477 RepID=A0AAE3ETX3_9FLAO|nr:transaldolase [Cerina litoralis]MCG2461022.1 transaldolase [Cerina litoralis]
MNKISFYLFFAILGGCNVGENKSSGIYFGGEIVNPTSDYVVLCKDDSILDSVRLDENNRFALKLDSVTSGLYHFDHSPEYAYVYLEKGDSLQVRLNTVDFDESLVFSGKGEEINNFLVELFLANEADEKTVNSYYELDPESFNFKVDSLVAIKKNNLDQLKSQVSVPQDYLDIAMASINFNSYAFKEKYPFIHRRRVHQKSIPELPPNFYDYRKKINYNDRALAYYRPYYDYMVINIGNMSYMNCMNKCGDKGEGFNKLHFNEHKLKLIDSIFKERDLRDNLFRNVAMDYLLKTRDSWDNNRIFMEEFHKYSDNNEHIAEIDDVYQGIQNLRPDSKVPNVLVYDALGHKVDLQKISKKYENTVFYFWTGTQRMHFDNMARRIHQLSIERPDYTFIGINFNTDSTRWKAMVELNKLDTSTQFRSDNFQELTKALIIYPINKGIITKDGLIVDAFANIYGSF